MKKRYGLDLLEWSQCHCVLDLVLWQDLERGGGDLELLGRIVAEVKGGLDG